MCKNVTLRVDGDPKAQPRPRSFAMRGKSGKYSARVYDPGTAEFWKSLIAIAAREKIVRPFAGPVVVEMSFCIRRPKSHYRTGKNAAQLKPAAPNYHTSKPDVDNFAKAVLDALTTIGAWKDDSQVAGLSARKIYGEQPGAIIQIAALPEVEN